MTSLSDPRQVQEDELIAAPSEEEVVQAAPPEPEVPAISRDRIVS